MRFVPGTTDVLASRAKLGVIVPSTNSTVGPEYEMLRPHGVTHHIGRMVLPPRPYDNMDTYRQALEHEEGGLHEALEVLMNCEPHAVAQHTVHRLRDERAIMLAEARLRTEVRRQRDVGGLPHRHDALERRKRRAQLSRSC